MEGLLGLQQQWALIGVHELLLLLYGGYLDYRAHSATFSPWVMDHVAWQNPMTHGPYIAVQQVQIPMTHGLYNSSWSPWPMDCTMLYNNLPPPMTHGLYNTAQYTLPMTHGLYSIVQQFLLSMTHGLYSVVQWFPASMTHGLYSVVWCRPLSHHYLVTAAKLDQQLVLGVKPLFRCISGAAPEGNISLGASKYMYLGWFQRPVATKEWLWTAGEVTAFRIWAPIVGTLFQIR